MPTRNVSTTSRDFGLRNGAVNGKSFNGAYIGGIDEVDIRLGPYNDEFLLDIRKISADSPALVTQLVLGAGDDNVRVKSAGPTTILGGTGTDTLIVGNDKKKTDDILSNLHFDGSGTIVEQGSAITYHPASHDAMLAHVPRVHVYTAGGTPDAPVTQYKEAILSSTRTAHVSVFGAKNAGITSPQITRLDRNLAQYWTDANVELYGPVTVGNTWTLQLNNKDYTYTAEAGDGLSRVADRLAARASQDSANSDFTINASGQDITIENSSSSGENKYFSVQVFQGLGQVATITGSLYAEFMQFELRKPRAGLCATTSPEETCSWLITVDGHEYEHTWQDGDTLTDIATSLTEKINQAARSYTAAMSRYLDIYVKQYSPFTGKPIPDTVHYRGQNELGYLETGYELSGYGVKGYDDSGTIVVDPGPCRF